MAKPTAKKGSLNFLILIYIVNIGLTKNTYGHLKRSDNQS